MRLVASRLGAGLPVAAPDAGAYLLVEVAGPVDPTDALAAALAGSDAVLDAAVATSGPDRARLWRFREGHPEVAAQLGIVHKLDVTLPTAELGEFCVTARERIAAQWPDASTLIYGHVGDGNVHVNVVLADEGAGEAVDDLVLGLVVARHGSISAEHGIGIAKRAWLPRDRSPEELAAMRAIKSALDPDGILNPNVLLPPH
jgi:FAD/FMN-containing dehydrogenase